MIDLNVLPPPTPPVPAIPWNMILMYKKLIWKRFVTVCHLTEWIKHISDLLLSVNYLQQTRPWLSLSTEFILHELLVIYVVYKTLLGHRVYFLTLFLIGSCYSTHNMSAHHQSSKKNSTGTFWVTFFFNNEAI